MLRAGPILASLASRIADTSSLVGVLGVLCSVTVPPASSSLELLPVVENGAEHWQCEKEVKKRQDNGDVLRMERTLE